MPVAPKTYAHSLHGFTVAYSGVPYPRKFVRDAAIAESKAATLDWVAVSERKKGMIYIKGGRRKTHIPPD
jgi:hypothetical protein